jgi:hypothetical protein
MEARHDDEVAARGEEILMRRALFLLFAAVLLAGCGGDTVSLDPLAEAATKTRDVPGAHFVMNGRIEAAGEVVEFRGPGEVADHGRKLHMRMTMPAEILGMKGAAGGDVTFEAVGAGRYFYFRGGPFSELAGGKWVRIRDDSPLINLGQNDPSQMLEYLRATSEVETVGEETVRDVETTHYEARIQLDKVAERASPEAAQALRRLTQGADIEEIPLEVWVDDESLVRRLRMDWHPKGTSFTFDLEMFGFGDVEIDVPEPSEAVDMTKLLGGG